MWSAASNCSSLPTCSVRASDETCLCEVHVDSQPVFVDASATPSVSEIRSKLKIGALCPTPAVSSVLPYTKAWPSSSNDGSVFAHMMTADTFDSSTIFELRVDADEPRCLANRESLVHIRDSRGETAYAFRNPPKFVSFINPTPREIEHEIESLIDHLFNHPNLPPFIAYRLIQRLVTSNPSPRYVEAVANAIATGKYNGVTFSGKRGDLKAAVYAILLDREARSITLDAAPSAGQLREPLLKLVHALRR